MMLCLNRLPRGCWGKVAKIRTDKILKRRLGDFGLVPGTKVRWNYSSPGGDVLALELRSTVLAIRTCDAEKIQVFLL